MNTLQANNEAMHLPVEYWTPESLVVGDILSVILADWNYYPTFIKWLRNDAPKGTTTFLANNASINDIMTMHMCADGPILVDKMNVERWTRDLAIVVLSFPGWYSSTSTYVGYVFARYIPEKFLTLDVFIDAVRWEKNAIRGIPKRYRTESVLTACVQAKPKSWDYLSREEKEMIPKPPI